MTENYNLPPPFLIYHPLDTTQQNELRPILEAAALEATERLQLLSITGRPVEVHRKLKTILLRDSAVEIHRDSLARTNFSIQGFIEEVHAAAALQSTPQSLPIKRYGWWPRAKAQKHPGNLLGAELQVDSDKTILLARQRNLVVDALGRAGVRFLSVGYVNDVQLFHVPPHDGWSAETQKIVQDIAAKHLGEAGVKQLLLGPIEVLTMNKRMRAARQRRKDQQKKDQHFGQ